MAITRLPVMRTYLLQTFQVRRDVLLARAWRTGDFKRAGELCAEKSERHIVAEQLQMVRAVALGVNQRSRSFLI